jgi:general secretion pathway protein D
VFRCLKTDAPGFRIAFLAALLAVAGGGGCATQRAESESKDAIKSENWDAAVYNYLELVAKHPDNVEYRIGLRRARQKAAHEHFQRGMVLREIGQIAAAANEMEMAVQLDPSHQFAGQVLEDLRKEVEILSGPGGRAELEQMKREAREAKVKPPVLDPTSKEPVTLVFPKPKPVKEIYDAIGKAYGFNVIFDPKLKDDRIPIELRDVTSERALEIVMQAAGHFYKVLDPKTIVVAEDNPQNRRDYEDLVIKTFFLSNADVKEVDKLLRSLIEARRLSTNEQLNAITLRDTADKVAIAEKLITVNDKAKAEVLVDVELLEYDTAGQSEIGMSLSTYSFILGVDTAVTSPDAPEGTSFLDDLSNISRENVFVNVPSVTINLIKSSGKASVLAQPQLRITEGEKASLHLGERVPIPVTSFNTSNTVGGNVVPITSFQYQDIGIKIEVEPRVHHNREVTLKLTVEVSQLGDTVPVGPNQEAVTIGTRTITSVIRLASGETSLLAGLIRKDQTQGSQEIPLLSDIPVVGRLFTNVKQQTRTTDLVLTLTPHIIRFPDIEQEDLAPVWVGTESRISFFGSRSPRVQSGTSPQGPFDAGGEDDQGDQGEESPPEDGGEEKPAPYGVRGRSISPRRAPPASGDTGGVELVPRGDDRDTWPGDDQAPEGGLAAESQAAAVVDDSRPPLIVGLEPSVVALASGSEIVLQLVVEGAPGSYRLPLGLTYNPGRLTVQSFEPAPGVNVMEGSIELDNGWMSLDLMVAAANDGLQAIGALTVRAEAPGPVPLAFTSAGATLADGTVLPVAASDGALFVSAAEEGGN